MQAIVLTKELIQAPVKENSWRCQKSSQKAYTPEFIFHNMGTTLFWQVATEQLNIYSCITSGWKQSFFIRKSNVIGTAIIFPVQSTHSMVVFDRGTSQTEWEDKQRHREHKRLWGLDFHILGHWWNNGTGPRSLGISCKALSYVLPYVREASRITHRVAMG